MAVARLGYAPAGSAGRFPRWGYLDKFYVNPTLPRALVVAAVYMGLCGRNARLHRGPLAPRAEDSSRGAKRPREEAGR